MDGLSNILTQSFQIHGWIRGEEAAALARAAYDLPDEAIVIQIGTFLGSSAVLLAGARKLKGSGKVHCVDPFDCSGDEFSIPHYKRLLQDSGGGALRDRFENNIARAGLTDWVEVHQATAEVAARSWRTPIDMLALNGDQSPDGAQSAYDHWAPFLKPGGTIAVHNSAPGEYAATHDGHRRVVEKELVAPRYEDVHCVVYTTFARRHATAP